MSSKKKRRYENYIKRIEKSKIRQELFKSLQNAALPEEQQKLLQSSRTLGKQKKEKRNKEHNAVQMNEEYDAILEEEEKKRLEYIEKKKKEEESKKKAEIKKKEEELKKKQQTEENKKKALESNNSKKRKNSEVNTNDLTMNASKKTKSESFTKIEETPIQNKKASFRLVERLSHIQEERLLLPIIMEEQPIMEAIKENEVVIICGETGSGKTTQVPQFLYEAGFGSPDNVDGFTGLIGITEPRRVAAITMSQRVAYELNLENGKEVGYQIRYDTKVSPNTLIKFMTDGILLREIQSDFLLTKYSAIILDEAHERSLNTDVLIGLLSRIVPLRNKMARENKLSNGSKVLPIRLIIMSATLRIEDFVSNPVLFSKPPPLISISSRQYPVSTHFNKVTPDNYLEEAFKKVCKIHRKLPKGGILVFLTGQQEIEYLCKKLRNKFPENPPIQKKPQKKEQVDDEENESKEEEEDEEREEEIENQASYQPLYVLPLYSVLPTHLQLRVFQPPPDGTRLVVVATNVAETSLTIPGISYVIDTGKCKELVYDKISGISEYVITWTSQASANQRSGRSGRTGPGHCYRLYSSAVFSSQFSEFSEPEIKKIPIEGIVLQMKNMGIQNVVNFPFPTPPERESISAAVKTLMNLGALEKETENITKLGKLLAVIPVAPRFAKMLIYGKQDGCLPYVIAIVAALTVRDPLLRDIPVEEEKEDSLIEEKEEENEDLAKENAKKRRELRSQAHLPWINSESDLLTILNAIKSFEEAGGTQTFCEKKSLHFKSMQEIHSLREQLTNLLNSVDSSLNLEFSANLDSPSKDQEILIRQIITSGLIDQVGKLYHEGRDIYYKILNSTERIYIHPTSFLASKYPDYITYKEIRTTSKPYMKGITAIEPSWLVKLGEPLCHFSKPLDSPPPRYDPEEDKIKCFVKINFGPHSWELPVQEIEYPKKVEKYKYFARFFLEGQIFPKMKLIQPQLNTKPSLMTKPYSQNKIIVFTQALQANDICSKKKLEIKWKEDKKFLLSAISLWVDRSFHSKVVEMWPPISDLTEKENKLIEKHSKPQIRTIEDDAEEDLNTSSLIIDDRGESEESDYEEDD